MQIFLFRFLNDRSATTAIEYAIVASGIAMAIVAVIAELGGSVEAKFESVNTGFK